MLALAAPSFGRPSETFIHDHARLLSPGATVLVCWDEAGAQGFGFPVFAERGQASPSGLSGRLADGLRRRWIRRTEPILATLSPTDYSPPSKEDASHLTAFLRRHAPTAMLAEYGPVGSRLLDVCRKAGLPLFVHFHGWDANILGASPTMRRRYRRLFSLAAGVIVTTQFLKRQVLALGCPDGKIHVCPCGVDTTMFTAGPAVREKRVLMVSRLIPWKGPQLSLESFERVCRRHPDAVLEIIGDGVLRPDLEAAAQAYGLGDRVVFHGARDHAFVRDRMRNSRLLIQHCVTRPNDSVESQGLSILEAMACEAPVVATRHGAITETVQDGVTGRLVDEYDTAAMADAIDTLLKDRDLAAAMGRAGRSRVIAHYDQAQAIQRLRDVLGVKV